MNAPPLPTNRDNHPSGVNRRGAIKAAAAMTAAGLAGGRIRAAEPIEKKQLSVAGYAYDRTRPIQDGTVGIDGIDVQFHAENIYGLNANVFGPPQKYSRAKRAAYADLETTTALKVSLPWATQEFEETRSLMGRNYWPYGIKANRKELDLVMRYTHEQGLAKRRISIEEVFHPSTLEFVEAEG